MVHRPDPAARAAAIVALADALASRWRVDPLTLGRVATVVDRLDGAAPDVIVAMVVAALAAPDREPMRLRPVVEAWAATWLRVVEPQADLEPEDAQRTAWLPPPPPSPPPRRGWSWSDVDPGAWVVMAGLVLVVGLSALAPRAPVVGSAPVDVDRDGVAAPADCDDADASVRPGAREVPGDGVDQDCDGADEAAPVDGDGDGVPAPTDCDDANAEVHPGAPDPAGDGVDQDCNGLDGAVPAPVPPPTTREVLADAVVTTVSPPPSRVSWAAILQVVAAMVAAWLGWRAIRKAADAWVQLDDRRHPEPPEPPEREALLLDPAQQAAAAQAVERHAIREPSRRLDAPATVDATSRAGGIPKLRYARQRAWLGAWIWQQEMDLHEPEAERLARDLEAALLRAGLPVRRSTFWYVPRALHTDREVVSPIRLPAGDRAARVLVFQRCEDLVGWLGERRHTTEGVSLMRAMAEFPALTIVGFGPGFEALEEEARPYGLHVVPASRVLEVVTDTVGAPLDLRLDDLRRWQEAIAVLPAAVGYEDALRLRRELDLNVSALLWPRLAEARGGRAVTAIAWTSSQRARHLERATAGRVVPVIAWWRARFADREGGRVELTRALLDVWDRPDAAAEALEAQGEAHRPAIRAALDRCAPRDLVGGDAASSIVLLWMSKDHPDAFARLRKLGLGAALTPVKTREVLPGRRWIGLAGLAGMAAVGFAAAIGRWAAPVETTCAALDARVTCACAEATCVAVSRSDLQVLTVEPGSAVTASVTSAPMPCVEARAFGQLRRCVARAAAAPDGGARRPVRTLAVLEGGADAARLADALLDASTVDLALLASDDITADAALWAQLSASPNAGAAPGVLTGTDDVLADLAQWARSTAPPDAAAAPALRVLTVTDGPGGAVVADVGALAARLEGLAEDITIRDLDDVAQPRNADVADWPLLRAARCGDSWVDAGEACDGGARCDASCQPRTPSCGDAALDPGEQCDLGADRNAVALDCNPGCQLPSVDVPAAAYTIGSPVGASGVDADETPPWRMLTDAFRIQKTEVTQALYAQVMGGLPTTSRLPQTDVRWDDANTFCARVGGRLPTEAEWEAAARSVSQPGARFPWGDDPAGAAGRAWVGGVALHEVASASAPGPLPDIVGNAWEWTSDCWEPEIYEDRARGRVGVASPRNRWCQPYVGDGDVEIAEPKVARGGSASVGVEAARITNRRVVSPTADGVGLRCVWGGDPKVDDGLRWVHVPDGPHWIGAVPGDGVALKDEKPGWEATFPGGFEILATEVPAVLKPGFAGTGEEGRLPWVEINWADAKAFCEANGARLPTEVEWEAAARGGTRTKYACGEEAGCLDGSAWWSGNAEGEAHRVGTRAPNAWGVHDAYGNVWEWVEDCYREDAWGTLSTMSTNPGVVDMPECSARVLRGGSFNGVTRDLRASDRYRVVPSFQYGGFGFRCVRGVRRQSLLVP